METKGVVHPYSTHNGERYSQNDTLYNIENISFGLLRFKFKVKIEEEMSRYVVYLVQTIIFATPLCDEYKKYT